MVKDLVSCSLLLDFFPGCSLKSTERGPGMTRWLYSVLWPLGKACLLDGLAGRAGDLKTAVVFLALSRPQRQGCQDAATAEGLWGALYLRRRGSAAPGAPPHLPPRFRFPAEARRAAPAALMLAAAEHFVPLRRKACQAVGLVLL